jgi:hypothetical protein
MLKKKIWAYFLRIIEVYTQKTFTKLSKIWVWDPDRDPRSGIRKKTYSGSRIQGSKRHRIPEPGSGSETLKIYFNFKNMLVLFYGLCIRYMYCTVKKNDADTTQ